MFFQIPTAIVWLRDCNSGTRLLVRMVAFASCPHTRVFPILFPVNSSGVASTGSTANSPLLANTLTGKTLGPCVSSTDILPSKTDFTHYTKKRTLQWPKQKSAVGRMSDQFNRSLDGQCLSYTLHTVKKQRFSNVV